MTSTRLSLLIAAVVALVIAIGVATVVLVRARSSTDHGPAQAQLGGVTLVYPPAYARFNSGRTGGRFDRLELAFAFPGLRGAGTAAAALPADDDIVPDKAQTVFLTLRPEDEAMDPASRTETLYGRFLQSDVWQEDDGLVMRRFEVGSPYEREELHFVPPEGRVFAARCMRPTQPPSDLPSTCLSGIRLDGLDVDIRFSPTLLPQWEAVSDGARRLVNSFVRK